MSTTEQRVPLAEARRVADALVDALQPGTERIAIAGSIRRGRADVGDVEIVAIPRRFRRTVADGLFEQREIVEDEQAAIVDVLLARGELGPHPTDPKRGERYAKLVDVASGLQVDIFSVRTSTWGVGLLIRTGPADYSRWFVNECRRRGQPRRERLRAAPRRAGLRGDRLRADRDARGGGRLPDPRAAVRRAGEEGLVTVGVTGVVVRPLHEVVDMWKRGQRQDVAIGPYLTRPRACGGTITARLTPKSIAYAVKSHGDSEDHVDWAIRNGWRHA